jgi:hypothetical protein
MTLLPGSVNSATPGAQGFDASVNLAASDITLLAKTFTFCLRYVPYNAWTGGDVTYDEAKSILQAGLALMPIYPYPGSGWQPDGASGTVNGNRAISGARTAGFPDNMNLWMDLEGIADGWPAQSVIDHCNAWYDVVEAAGFVPGLYVGLPCGLTGDQLYSSLKFHHYWRSESTSSPAIPVRGYQVIPSLSTTPADLGFEIDPDVTQRDNLGGNAQWLVVPK